MIEKIVQDRVYLDAYLIYENNEFHSYKNLNRKGPVFSQETLEDFFFDWQDNPLSFEIDETDGDCTPLKATWVKKFVYNRNKDLYNNKENQVNNIDVNKEMQYWTIAQTLMLLEEKYNRPVILNKMYKLLKDKYDKNGFSFNTQDIISWTVKELNLKL